MQIVVYTDPHGYRRVKQIRDDDDPDHPEIGLPYGPPDINILDWDEIRKELNNLLVDRQLWNETMVQAHPDSFRQVLGGVLYARLLSLYREGHHS